MKLNITRALTRPAGAAAGLYVGSALAARLPAQLPSPQYTVPLALGITGYVLDGMQNQMVRSAGVALGAMAWLQLLRPLTDRLLGGAA